MAQRWINIHTHKPGAGINIVDPCLLPGWEPAGENIFVSRGIHPLFIDETAEEKLREIEQLAADGAIIAVGEAGLDRNATATMERQKELFAAQASIAARYHLPLIIHGVRAIPELITVYKECACHEKWIIHGFNNRREILQDLLRHGFYISVGRQMMNEKSNVFQLLPQIPDDRLFIETDHSDYGIEEIYRKVAVRKDISVEQLQEMIDRNFTKVFDIV